MNTTMKFPLGQVVATAAVAAKMERSPAFAAGVSASIRRHALGDWGDVCGEDRQTNEDALAEGSRLLSSYQVEGEKLWVITEWDRSVTTALFPSDY